MFSEEVRSVFAFSVTISLPSNVPFVSVRLFPVLTNRLLEEETFSVLLFRSMVMLVVPSGIFLSLLIVPTVIDPMVEMFCVSLITVPSVAVMMAFCSASSFPTSFTLPAAASRTSSSSSAASRMIPSSGTSSASSGSSSAAMRISSSSAAAASSVCSSAMSTASSRISSASCPAASAGASAGISATAVSAATASISPAPARTASVASTDSSAAITADCVSSS